jgi:hypothetical protein
VLQHIIYANSGGLGIKADFGEVGDERVFAGGVIRTCRRKLAAEFRAA